MYRKFYKLLIIGNFQGTILLIPTWNDGIMEWWNNGVLGYWDIEWMHGCTKIIQSCNHASLQFPHSPNLPNPTLQYSNIPTFQLRSEAKLNSNV